MTLNAVTCLHKCTNYLARACNYSRLPIICNCGHIDTRITIHTQLKSLLIALSNDTILIAIGDCFETFMLTSCLRYTN